jgi:vancomycin resistance protein VanJ
MKRRFRGLAIAAGNVYTGVLLGFVLLQRTGVGDTWPMKLAANFQPYLFLPLLLLVPLIVILRSRLAKLIICLPCALFLLLYGQLFVPQLGSVSTGSEQTLTVMTYNVTRGDPGVEHILSIIQSEDADIVALQEVSPKLAEALAQLGDRYPYQALHPTPDGYAGSAVLSRYLLSGDEVFPLVDGTHLFQRVTIDVRGTEIHLLNVHLQPPRVPVRRGGSRILVPAGYDTSTQDRELERLFQEMEKLGGPIVAVGDFNMTDQSPGYRKLTRNLEDAYREAGWGFGHTFPDVEVRSIATPLPVVRIDYVFHSRDMAARRAYVGDRGGPNHRFLVAELSL